jgi:hypothetical protein
MAKPKPTSFWSNKRYPIDLKALVKRIEEALKLRQQWLRMGDLPRANEYNIQLETLVEWLECYDCGSVGGFGEGQQDKVNSDYEPTLAERTVWLLRKYGKA